MSKLSKCESFVCLHKKTVLHSVQHTFVCTPYLVGLIPSCATTGFMSLSSLSRRSSGSHIEKQRPSVCSLPPPPRWSDPSSSERPPLRRPILESGRWKCEFHFWRTLFVKSQAHYPSSAPGRHEEGGHYHREEGEEEADSDHPVAAEAEEAAAATVVVVAAAAAANQSGAAAAALAAAALGGGGRGGRLGFLQEN